MKARQTRHSKVYTSKGPRDRRVRLSAMTAIQFYDVQDRLGYDRPSEAVDWLILKAKASIEALPHKPNAVTPYSADGQNPMQDLPSSVKHARESFGQEKLRNLQASVSFPVENLGLLSTDHIHIPEFSFEMGNHAVDPFPMVGSQDCDLVPSSCLDQVVFSSSLFSKKTSPMQKSVFSSAPLASSMEEAPRKRRVLNWPFVTPPSIELQSSFQIGE